MVPLFQILGPSLVPLLSKTGPLFGPSEGLFEGGTRLVITVVAYCLQRFLRYSENATLFSRIAYGTSSRIGWSTRSRAPVFNMNFPL